MPELRWSPKVAYPYHPIRVTKVEFLYLRTRVMRVECHCLPIASSPSGYSLRAKALTGYRPLG